LLEGKFNGWRYIETELRRLWNILSTRQVFRALTPYGSYVLI
jgi:hypothetical protein